MKKALLVVLILCVLVSSLTMAKTLKIWIGGQVAELDQTWDDIISKYEKESGNEVEVQLFGFDVYYDKLLAALEAGFGPDLAFADLGGWVPTFAAKDWLVNLDSQIESWDGTDQIWPNLWPTVAYEGSLYGLPWYTDCRLLLYNKTMLKDAGFDNPPETWEEFCYVADKITDSSKRTYGYGVSGTKSEVTTLGYMMFLYAAGGELLTEDYSEPAFNTPEGLRALKFYTDLAKKWEVSPNALSYGEDDYRNMMAQGRVAMSVGGPWSFALIEQANPAIKGNYSVALHPYGAVPASVLGGWALVIPKSSENPEEAWGLAEYLTSYDTWMTWIEANGSPMPVRMDVCADAPTFDDEKWQVIFDAFPFAVCRPPIPVYPKVSEEIQMMVQNVLMDKMTPEEAIAVADANVREILGK